MGFHTPSPHSSLCPNTSYSYLSHATGEAYSVDCTGEQKNEDAYTMYGSCRDDDSDTTVCSFSAADCASTEVFKDPFVTKEKFGSCYCYEVHTGAW